MRQRIRYSLWSFSSLAVVLFLALAAFGQDRSEQFANSVLLPRGMVADSRGDIGFVPNGSAIAAVDLQTGRVLWTTRAASRPLLVGGDQVVALAGVEGRKNTVRVVVLDASPKAKGERVRSSEPMELSEWLISQVPEIRMDRGDLLLRWQTTRFLPRGKFGLGRLAAQYLAHVHLATGRVDRLSEKDLPGPELPEGVGAITSDGYFLGEGWLRNDPLIVGGKVVVVFDPLLFNDRDTRVDEIGKVALRRWDLASGEELRRVELLRTEGQVLRVSPDKRYVFAPILRNDVFHWTIFSLETGRLVGEMTSEGTSDMGILGPRVYVSWGDEEGHNLLIARDVKSGKTLWTLRLHDGR